MGGPMGTLVIDSSVGIELERGNPLALSAVEGERVVVPAVVLAELLTATWFAKSDASRLERRRLTQILEDRTDLAVFGAREADILAELRAYCMSRGELRSENDLMIAAHAIAERAALCTNDRRARFEELPGLLVQYL